MFMLPPASSVPEEPLYMFMSRKKLELRDRMIDAGYKITDIKLYLEHEYPKGTINKQRQLYENNK